MAEDAEIERGIKLHKVLAAARRRRWWIIVPLVLGPAAGYMISLEVTPVYTSQAFVLVEQQKVPDAFVPSMVMDQLETRLMTMQDQILSRSRLQPIIEEFGLYKNDRQTMPVDERVARLRKDIQITPIRPDSTNALRGFYVMVNANKASTAQQVCSRVLSMFMEENLKARSERAESTTEFLAGQLQDAKQKLDDNDAKLAAFKTKYLGRLPTDEQGNLQMLSTLSSRLDAVNEAISQAQQQRVTQMSMLAQQTASPVAESTQTAASQSDLDRRIADLRSQLAALETRYTPEHPEIAKAKEQLAGLQRQRAMQETTEPEAASPKRETTESTQLRASLRAIDETIRSRKVEQTKLEEAISSFQERIQLSPAVEEQYKALTRDYEGSLQFYNDLLAKKTQSEMVRDLEQKREGEQFRVMDAPALPSKPSFPDRTKFALGGLAGGFALGTLFAAVRDLRERLVRTEEDVALYLQIPILGMVQDFTRKENATIGRQAV